MDDFVQEVKMFVSRNILRQRGSTYYNEARELQERYSNAYNGHSLCPSLHENEELRYELSYYMQMVTIIEHRLAEHEDITQTCCASHSFRSRQPNLIFDNRWSVLVKTLIMFFLFASAVSQFVRAQNDGELSAWSHMSLSVATVLYIGYFSTTRQYAFMLPHLGNLLFLTLQLRAIFVHQSEPLEKW
jgi:hypothetical protein